VIVRPHNAQTVRLSVFFVEPPFVARATLFRWRGIESESHAGFRMDGLFFSFLKRLVAKYCQSAVFEKRELR